MKCEECKREKSNVSKAIHPKDRNVKYMCDECYDELMGC